MAIVWEREREREAKGLTMDAPGPSYCHSIIHQVNAKWMFQPHIVQPSFFQAPDRWNHLDKVIEGGLVYPWWALPVKFLLCTKYGAQYYRPHAICGANCKGNCSLRKWIPAASVAWLPGASLISTWKGNPYMLNALQRGQNMLIIS